MHVMIDLETLGVRPDACIIQVGAVMFDPAPGGALLNGKGFNRHVLLQDGSGTIDHGTVCFWLSERSAASMGRALSERAYPTYEVLQDLVDWPKETLGIGWDAIEGVWAAPADFDLPLLKSAFARLGSDVPWGRRTTRDARTLFYLVGGPPEVDRAGLTLHDAFDDAVAQAIMVQKAMGMLR